MRMEANTSPRTEVVTMEEGNTVRTEDSNGWSEAKEAKRDSEDVEGHHTVEELCKFSGASSIRRYAADEGEITPTNECGSELIGISKSGASTIRTGNLMSSTADPLTDAGQEGEDALYDDMLPAAFDGQMPLRRRHSYLDSSKGSLLLGASCCAANIVLYVANGEITRLVESEQPPLTCPYLLIWLSHILQSCFLPVALWKLHQQKKTQHFLKADIFSNFDNAENQEGQGEGHKRLESENISSSGELLDSPSQFATSTSVSSGAPSSVTLDKGKTKSEEIEASPAKTISPSSKESEINFARHSVSSGGAVTPLTTSWSERLIHCTKGKLLHMHGLVEDYVVCEMSYSSFNVFFLGCFALTVLYVGNAWCWCQSIGDERMSVGIVTAIFNTNPVFIFIFSALIYSEGGDDCIQIVAIILAMIGVLLISYHSEGEPTLSFGLLMAVLCAAQYGLFEVLYKNYILQGRSNPPITFIWLFVGLMGLIILVGLWIPIPVLHYTGLEIVTIPTFVQGILLLFNALCVTTFQFFLQLSLAMLPSPLMVGLASLLCMPVAEFTDWFLKTGRMNTPTLVGSAFVGLSFIIMIAHEANIAREEKNSYEAAFSRLPSSQSSILGGPMRSMRQEMTTDEDTADAALRGEGARFSESKKSTLDFSMDLSFPFVGEKIASKQHLRGEEMRLEVKSAASSSTTFLHEEKHLRSQYAQSREYGLCIRLRSSENGDDDTVAKMGIDDDSYPSMDPFVEYADLVPGTCGKDRTLQRHRRLEESRCEDSLDAANVMEWTCKPVIGKGDSDEAGCSMASSSSSSLPCPSALPVRMKMQCFKPEEQKCAYLEKEFAATRWWKKTQDYLRLSRRGGGSKQDDDSHAELLVVKEMLT